MILTTSLVERTSRYGRVRWRSRAMLFGMLLGGLLWQLVSGGHLKVVIKANRSSAYTPYQNSALRHYGLTYEIGAWRNQLPR